MNFQQSQQLDTAIGQTLRDRRRELGLPILHVSKLLGIPHSFVNKVETGNRKLSAGEFDSYCLALDISRELVIANSKKTIQSVT
ncbi:helix-turn-helix transcriptional regulator [Psychrosphaera aquimarina]|uniref:Helix-turn-helix transcriptional regulator n=1 Tax=Psychrosphaera aquimarina TaxID=2044854 RepID=A0ABU3QWD4_9GAMM|nr:helix-turn-helix transcriptional regulator [Psychrosphaera aquimarina]MDU0111744.1 helix-turn-helix transcriptional regulator [Psychrosphaera aquimarina]